MPPEKEGRKQRHDTPNEVIVKKEMEDSDVEMSDGKDAMNEQAEDADEEMSEVEDTIVVSSYNA